MPLLRFSFSRDAYVLKGIGNRYGPVLVPRPGGEITRTPATGRWQSVDA